MAIPKNSFETTRGIGRFHPKLPQRLSSDKVAGIAPDTSLQRDGSLAGLHACHLNKELMNRATKLPEHWARIGQSRSNSFSDVQFGKFGNISVVAARSGKRFIETAPAPQMRLSNKPATVVPMRLGRTSGGAVADRVTMQTFALCRLKATGMSLPASRVSVTACG
jgi:hypothetical protein